MEQKILEIAAKIKDISIKRENLASELINSNKDLKIKLSENKFNKKICGVDGGFLKKEYHGINIILRRALGACFTYKNSKLNNIEYCPASKEMPEPLITGPEFSDQEFNQLASLKRLEKEIEIAIKSVDELKPDILILDGSILPHPSSVPSKKAPIYPEYRRIVTLFQTLFSRCSSNNISLIGAIEDSKGQKFCKHLIAQNPSLNNINILTNTTDTLFIYYLLHNQEAIKPIISENKHLPEELSKFSKNIYTTFIKPAEHDRPLRLDIFCSENKLIETIEIINQISKQNNKYTYPAVLIEADARAKLADYEIDLIKASIAEKLGNDPSVYDLRRDLRPF